MCSFGDAIAVSEVVDLSLAHVLTKEVSDLIIAPGFDLSALEILKQKKQGRYVILQIDPDYEPPQEEARDLFGFRIQQKRNNAQITRDLFKTIVAGKSVIPSNIIETLMVATIALKYTQSNSICIAYDGQVIGMGAGQQSRIHCTRLACDKADKWMLQQHPKVLNLKFKEGLKKPEKTNIMDQFLLWDQLSGTEREQMFMGLLDESIPISSQERREWIERFDGVCLSSDAYIPFRDNIDRANKSNVKYIAHAGNSLRDGEVTEAADQYSMTMIHTGFRLFLH